MQFGASSVREQWRELSAAQNLHNHCIVFSTAKQQYTRNCEWLQLGVGSVREHMEGAISKLEKFNKQKMALASQASKVRQALAYEGSSDAGKKVKEQEIEVAKSKAKLRQLEEQEAAGRQFRQAQEADLEEKVGLMWAVTHHCHQCHMVL